MVGKLGPAPACEEFAIPAIKPMKLTKYLFAIAAITVALTLSAKADLSFLGAVDFNNGPNSPDANLAALAASGVDTTGFTLCGNFEELSGDQNIDVMAGSFLVVHYGTGKGGTGSGGSLEFFQVINGETNVTVPGFPNANDPFATGGISSIREFCPPSTVPDSGTTAMLLGSALTGLGLVRRYLKR
jgi:hypothetical protein